jgi:conjugal transfer mating pair stabilization protein TraG
MIWEIYSYWNVAELKGVLEAIAMITGSSDYLTLLSTGMMFGLIGVSVAVLTGTQDLLAAFRWFIVSLIMYFVMFVPKADVAVIDRTGTSGATVVSNVPLAIAVFGHVTSLTGDWLTTSYETTMKVIHPSYASEGIGFQGNGLMFGQKLLMEAERAKSGNVVYATNMSAFFDKCVMPEFDTGNINMSTALKSNDFWGAIGNVNPSLYVQLYNLDGTPTPSPVACNVAYNSVLPSIMTRVETDVINRASERMYPDKNSILAKAAFDASLSGSYGFFTGVSLSSTDIIRQKLLTNTFFDASQDPRAVAATVTAQESAKLNYSVLYNMAHNTIPKIRNVIESILYAVFPIILLMIIVGGTKGLVVIKSYLIGLVWIQLWAPLYAVMNFIISVQDAKKTQALSLAGEEISALNSTALQADILGSSDIAGMMAMAIPMIAYAIVKGGEMAMTSFVSGATRPVEMNASQSAREVATGNISLGNTSQNTHSMDTVSGLNHNMQPVVNNGANMRTDGSGHTLTTNDRGMTAHNSKGMESQGAFHNFQSAISAKNSYSKDYEESTKAAEKLTSEASFTVGSAFGSSGMISKAASGGSNFGSEFGVSSSKGTESTFQKLDEVAKGLETSTGLKQGQAAELVAGVAGSIGTGGIGADLKGSLQKKFGDEAVAQAIDKISGIDKNSLSEAAKVMEQSVDSDKLQKSLGLSDESRTSIQGENKRSEDMREASKAELEKADTYKEKMSRAEERIEQAMFEMGAATPFNSMNDAGKRFATGEGSALLGQAMEARNRGDYALSQSFMKEFDQRLTEYSSQFGAPTGENIGEVKGKSEVLNQHKNMVDGVLETRGENQKMVGSDNVINNAQANVDAKLREQALNEDWVKQSAKFDEERFEDVSKGVTTGADQKKGEQDGNKQVAQLERVELNENGTLVNENGQTGRVVEAAVNDTASGVRKAANFLSDFDTDDSGRRGSHGRNSRNR